jgi:hypothetical protein
MVGTPFVPTATSSSEIAGRVKDAAGIALWRREASLMRLAISGTSSLTKPALAINPQAMSPDV